MNRKFRANPNCKNKNNKTNCSNVLVMREMNIRATMNYHFTPNILATILKSVNIYSCGNMCDYRLF